MIIIFSANTLMEWVKGAMDALEKGYLKDLIFIVYLNENHDEVYEMYKFTFGPKGTITLENPFYEILYQEPR